MGLWKSKSANRDVDNDSDIAARSLRVHNKLLYVTLAIDFFHSTVDNGIPEQQFRAGVRNYVDDPLSKSAKDVAALLDILEKKGLIGLGDYDVLKDIVHFDVRVINEINDIELVLQNHGTPIYNRLQNGRKRKECFVDRGKNVIVYG